MLVLDTSVKSEQYLSRLLSASVTRLWLLFFRPLRTSVQVTEQPEVLVPA